MADKISAENASSWLQYVFDKGNRALKKFLQVPLALRIKSENFPRQNPVSGNDPIVGASSPFNLFHLIYPIYKFGCLFGAL